MWHIGQDWKKKHLAVALENTLLVDRAMRDAFVRQVADSITLSNQPIAKTIPHNDAFRRKVTCWEYNQQGLYRGSLTKLPRIDRFGAQQGAHGTREWVPWLNIHQYTATWQLKSGKLLMHRVHYRGYGTDPHLVKGKWSRRWNKVFERDYLQLTKA